MNPILNYEKSVVEYLTEAVRGTKWEDKDDVIENEIKRQQEDNENYYYDLEEKYNPSRK